MAETQSRPTRGRGSYRGGRGGHSYRGGRGATKSAPEDVAPESFEDQGEIGELKKKYATKVPLLKEMFPDWTTEDLVFTLEETDGDETAAIDRITEGQASQWGEVKKKHVDRSRSKVKEASTGTTETTGTTARGRGRGGLETRGRGRGDRGRGRGGRAGAHTNGTRTADKPSKTTAEAFGDSVVTTTDTSIDTTAEATTNGDATATEPVKENIPVEAPKAAPAKPAAWSALFAKPPPVKATPKPAQPPAPVELSVPEPASEAPVEPTLPATQPEQSLAEQQTPPQNETTESDTTLTPSKDELTEDNVEQLPDVSHPPDTQTAASTMGSTQDPHSQLSSAVPLRPGLSGFATSALKATAATPRSASFQRRVLEQQEAVVMPGDRAVDRAAVQFGSMGLNGNDEAEGDEEREQPETRAQPPNDSPVAPRASLPPAPIHQQQPPLQQPSEPASAARPAPGLPPAPQQQSPIQPSAYSDYGRYGAKAYDPFGQQTMPAHSQPESFGAAQSHPQPPTTSAPAEYSSYYAANQQRDAYNSYYANYMQTQDAQQRTGSAFGSSGPDAPSQYGGRSSGHNTPNPTTQAQQQQPQQGQQLPHGQNAPGGYPYGGYPSTYAGYPQYNQYSMHHQHQYGRNRPMFDDARRYEDGSSYMGHNNYYGGHYGGSYGKGPNMYGQPQHQYSYDHSASPANASGFGPGSMSGRESGYRTGSAQPSEAQQSNSAYDPFGRSQSGFSGAQQSLAQQTGGDDASKSGPSPSLAQVNRPESAANSISNQHGSQSSSFPPPQSQQSQAFGGYPQYGLGGGFGGHQANQSNQGYGSYGAQGFGGYGYGRNNWGQYGH